MALVGLLSFQKFYWREKREKNAPSSYFKSWDSLGSLLSQEALAKSKPAGMAQENGKGAQEALLLPGHSKPQDSEQVTQEPPLIS